MDKELPSRLYKYREFNENTLHLILSDQVYFADPSTFNDPLDTRPSLETDVHNAQLEEILRRLFKRRIDAEMTTAAKSIRYRGPRTKDHIQRLSRRQVDRLLQDINYHATNTDFDPEERLRFSLRYYIEQELFRQYDKGIVSLAERGTCPLMWSHYADQHRGICIGYSVPDRIQHDIHKVKYRGSRLVQASKVAAMLDDSASARREVDEAVLLRKAGSWRYEREWRLLGPRGIERSPLEMEDISFGMRCKDSTMYAVMKALEARERPVRFYEMREVTGKFHLKRIALPYDDLLLAGYPARSLSMYDDFADISNAEFSGQRN